MARIEVVFRKGKPVTGFIHFGDHDAKKGRVIALRHSLSLHHNERLEPVGLEVVLPTQVSLEILNEVLRDYGQPPLTEADVLPLRG